jgi:hypothetical protein
MQDVRGYVLAGRERERMTDKTIELIESYKGWDVKEIKRYPLDAARVIADLLSKLEAEHQRAEEIEEAAGDMVDLRFHKRVEAERDALRTALEEIRALPPSWVRGMYGAPDDMYAGRALDRILSRAIDTKEEKP